MQQRFAIDERLSFICILNFVNPKLIKNEEKPKIHKSVLNSKTEFNRWLKARLKKWFAGQKLGYPQRGLFEIFKLILALKGFQTINEVSFQAINEKEYFTFLTNFDIERLDKTLKKIKIENKRCKTLIDEFLYWLSSQDIY